MNQTEKKYEIDAMLSDMQTMINWCIEIREDLSSVSDTEFPREIKAIEKLLDMSYGRISTVNEMLVDMLRSKGMLL